MPGTYVCVCVFFLCIHTYIYIYIGKYKCQICNCAFGKLKNFEQHLEGRQHRTNAAAVAKKKKVLYTLRKVLNYTEHRTNAAAVALFHKGPLYPSFF